MTMEQKQVQKKLGKLAKSYGTVINAETVTRKLILRDARILTSSVVGFLNSTIALDPSAAVGWTEVSTYWDEFRVVGATLNIYSMAPNSVTRICDLITVVYDNDDTTSLTSTVAAYSYTNKLVFPSVFTHINAKGIEFAGTRPVGPNTNIPWVDVSAASGSQGAFKFFSEILDTNTPILRVYIEYFVEVRGRR